MILKVTPALALLLYIFCDRSIFFDKKEKPLPPYNVQASMEQLFSDMDSPNKNGVYPVRISWNASEGASGYYIYRAVSYNGVFTRITETPIRDTFYMDTDTEAGVYYYYKIRVANSRGKPVYSAPVCGYGALTAECFYKEYSKTLFNSHKKLTLINNPNNWDKIGTETARGFVNGMLFYKTNVDLLVLGARITIRYENYTDFYSPSGSGYMIFDGNTDTIVKNFGKTGKMEGTVKVSGMYNGSIVYDNIYIKNSNAGGGYYIVDSGYLPPQAIPWNFE